MNYTDDGYAAMLLTMALSPDREEYARPLSTQEYRALAGAAQRSRYGGMGKLLDADVSGLMMYLSLDETEAMRVYTLLHRSVQLTYALEALEREGVEAVTCFDADYPQRLCRKLGDQAPVTFYRCGDMALLARPAIAIVGIGGVRTDDAVRDKIGALVREAARRDYVVITGGEPGVSRVAGLEANRCGAAVLDIVGGDLMNHIHLDGIAERIAMGRGLALSLVHPRAMFTTVHAAARNKALFALSDAAFIFNTDGRRGELGALQNRWCANVYAWEGTPGNRALYAHGAIPFGLDTPLDFDAMAARWSDGNAEQISMFDLM